MLYLAQFTIKVCLEKKITLFHAHVVNEIIKESKLNIDFVDADKEIEAKAGASISWIFDIEGEAGFRKREQQLIEELNGITEAVIATGVGAILLS